ncbi:MAG: IPTL-CTERM sorting domain-containing protein, partial [Burkholderiales bacterium]|nr:IPTL-CTERM sorting domain-containing protein [Burkholderiales bacterium]
VAWSPADAAFAYSTVYTATITLTAEAGYTFSGGFTDTAGIAGFTVNGIAPTFVNNTGTTLVFTVAFPVTGAVPSTPGITITVQPGNPAVREGAITGSLTVVATMNPSGPLLYQWYRNTTASNAGGTLIPGATNASYTIPTNLAQGTYHFYCFVAPAAATPNVTPVVSNVATVTVNARGGSGSTTPIPTLNPVGQVLLVLALGVAAFRQRRHCEKNR